MAAAMSDLVIYLGIVAMWAALMAAMIARQVRAHEPQVGPMKLCPICRKYVLRFRGHLRGHDSTGIPR